MTAQTKSFPLVDAVIDSFTQWIRHRREIAETCNCDVQELDRIARDFGVSADDLNEMVRRGPHAADELPQMIEALGLDPDAIARTHALVMYDMERVCAQCKHKQRCREDLEEGTTLQGYDEYCGNALTLESLRGKRH